MIQIQHEQKFNILYFQSSILQFQIIHQIYLLQTKMQQQLLEGTVNITPQTMDSILSELLTSLSSPNLDDLTLTNIIKALFYGLWNFDKMINQHNLSTAISQMPLSLPKQVRKNGIRFYEGVYSYLSEKWAFIDKHRINKFMQLVRYLIRESLNFCKFMKIKRSKADQILTNTIFKDLTSRSGLLYHVADIYFEIVANYCVQQNEQFEFHKLQIFENLLRNHNIQHFRHHIISQVYGKYKGLLIGSFKDSEEELQQQLEKIINHFLELAKKQQKQLHRKNLYLLVAYFKSTQMDFAIFQKEKRQKAEKQKEKVKKKLTVHKVKLIKQEKAKRKQKNKKLNKNKKVISKRKFEINGGKGYKKYIEDF